MSLDLRPLLTNATAEVLQEIVEDHALRAEILWAFVVLLHFAALLPLDPMFVHIFVCLLSWAGGSTRGREEAGCCLLGCPTIVALHSQLSINATPTDLTFINTNTIPLTTYTTQRPHRSGHKATNTTKMSSYLSNLLTTTTGRYNTLRRTLLSSEDDGDTEDDSHISRALRAYYTEKARPFPPWLPPDPNDRRAQQYPPQQTQAQAQGYYTSAGGRSQFQAGGSNSNRGSLNDLWDSPAAPAAPAAPQSLRAGRRVAPQGARPESGSNLGVPSAARPLPSQRVGSYQSFQSTGSGRVDPSPPPSSGGGGGGTAQERLKARLWGGARAASAAGGVSGNGGGNGSAGGGGGNPYDQGYDGGGGGSGRRFGRVT
ncbi:hypothetical protein Q7P35_001390 [Cladosporium inversicolor]